MRRALVAMAVAASMSAGACGGNAAESERGEAQETTETAASSSERVFPTRTNPISNDSKEPGLTITKTLVENNVNPETGKDAPDHLEVALKNTSSKPLGPVEVYYKISDPLEEASEGYYAELEDFTIAPGATRVAHFDGGQGKDHFPVNRYSLYYTDQDELVVEVMASAPGVKPAKSSVRKDAASAEAGVEAD